MLKKLMKHLTNNIGLKIVSVLFSIVLWLVVVNVADPDGTKSFSVPVEILNKNVIEEMGKVPDVLGDTDIAVFYITGPRSYVEAMNSDDFKVTADLSQVDLTKDDEAKLVPIEITPKKYEKYLTIHKRTVNMQITLEELSEKKFVISPDTAGTPAEGCAIGNVEVTPNLLAVSGPESIVSKISKVTATINVEGIASDVSDNVVPVLYDEEGNVISSDLLETNQSIVTIKANILGTKKLTIRCNVTGEPAEGYEYKGIEYAPQTVTVKGESADLNTMNVIPIPEDVIDIQGATSDVETTIDITPYLAEGISLVDESANQIAVKALIARKESKVFNLPVESINISGLPDNYELIYNATAVPVTIRASQEDIEGFDVGTIQASLDVSGMEPGTYTQELQLLINDEKYEIVGTTSVQITIKDKNAPAENDNSNANTGNGVEDTGGSEDNDDRNNSPDGRE